MCKKILCMITGILLFSLTGCEQQQVELGQVTIKPYERTTYETTTVLHGDITPELMLKLSPVEKMNVTYKPPVDDMEVDEVFVQPGDYISAGDRLVTFKSSTSEDKVKEYQEELLMQEMLIEHYEKLMQADSDIDYKEDIELLKKDMEVTKLYIAEESAKMATYTIKAEKTGVVDQVSDLMQRSKVNMSDRLITVLYNKGDYKVTVLDDYPFEIGMVVQGLYGELSYDMELTEIQEEARGSRTLIFRALDPKGVMRANFLDVKIEKSTLQGALYLPKNAVKEVDGKHYVFVLNEDGYRTGVEIQIGNVVDDFIIIKSGVKAGDKVVVD